MAELHICYSFPLSLPAHAELSEYAVQVDEEAEGMYGLVVHLKQRVRELEEQLKSVKSSQKMRSKCIGPDDSFPDEMK